MSETEGFAEPDGMSALREALETAQRSCGCQPAGEAAEDSPLPSEPAMDLLEAAWGIIANAGEGDWGSQRPEWREAAVRWRDRYHVMLRAFCENREAASKPEPSLPEGEYARVEIMGHDSVTGWVTDGTRAGVPVMVVSDWDGRVLREIPGHALYQYRPLATPLKRPEPRAAITAGDPWADDRDEDGDGEPGFLE